MFRDFVRFGMNFDWISPLVAMAQEIANGGNTRTFLIPVNCGWTGREIERLLRSRGIKTWGHMVINDTFTITVHERQARWAEYTLQQAGIPLET